MTLFGSSGSKPGKRGSGSAIRDAIIKDLKTFYIGSPIHVASPTLTEPFKDKLSSSQDKWPSSKASRTRRASNPASSAVSPTCPKQRRRSTNSQGLSTGQIESRNIDQSGCRLFQLPPEVRKKTWEYVLGGHFFFGPLLVNLESDDVSRSSDDFIDQTWTACSQKSFSVFSVLLTCRQMYVKSSSVQLTSIRANYCSYSEAVNILYSTNLFYHIGVEKFARHIPTGVKNLPLRFDTVRFLVFECNLDCYLYYDTLFLYRSNLGPFTGQMWSIFKEMNSLSVLYINIVSHSFVASTCGTHVGNTETEVFSPLMEMTGLKVFEVVVRWYNIDKGASRRCRLQNNYNEAPFRLTQIEEHGTKDIVMMGNESVVNISSWAANVLRRC